MPQMEKINLDGGYFWGELVDGIPCGKGTVVWGSGAKFEGEFRDGLRVGYGRTHYNNEQVEIGTYKNDRFIK